MKKPYRLAVLGGLLLAAVVLVRYGSGLPPNPHEFMDQEDKCGGCHTYWQGELEPHMFSVLVHEICQECHPELGRSHPINVNPEEAEVEIEITGDLPLAYIDELGEDVVSCGSCHNPHGPWLSTEMSFPEQEVEHVEVDGRREIEYFRTFYLRMSDPAKGFEPLCVNCHKDY